MAETTTTANNKSIAFRGKPEREMTAPRINAEGAPVDGKRPAIDKAKKLSPRGRKIAGKAIKRGMISEKAAKKHFGEG